ncbi:zinc transport system ATP-binding protein [Dethiosulfatibacter aminovorans DSM 17477]|uniref:Zinc transport system ATP-binding protein n=1 Tax=Dethiosulfatibacter aminovorans DSM 17477 TaxID=1121476 RepID=A0A1M6M3V3_9FIRM|nr:metal ABC transporter ATP-binding protein [Dethiosulfatibacter aminovorans]SHJ78096.1 zinc transport system ATP-binding protein [Dethiosulfatibacter aminovorans DSM 17477]
MEIKIRNLSVRYGTTKVLENINLDIHSKSFLGITGPNGGGKTTLLKTILGLKQPYEGEILKRKGLRIGYVPQHSSFDCKFPINVTEVVSMGNFGKRMKMFAFHKKSNECCIKKILKELNLYEVKNRHIGELSGGQLQRVLIARALCLNPDILILDEPTSSLDTDTRKDIFDILEKLSILKSIIVVSHEKNMLKKYADRVVCISKTIYFDTFDRITS